MTYDPTKEYQTLNLVEKPNKRIEIAEGES